MYCHYRSLETCSLKYHFERDFIAMEYLGHKLSFIMKISKKEKKTLNLMQCDNEYNVHYYFEAVVRVEEIYTDSERFEKRIKKVSML